MKFLQKLGKALMLPVAVLPICGILMGIGYYLCPATMQGGDIEGVRNLIGLFLVKAGGALIENMAILFVIGVGVGMSDKNDGTGGIAALASWLMMTTLLSTGFVTTIMPSIADSATKTLAFDKIQNPFIGILAGIIGSLCYNRFKDTKLPDWLSFFSGKRCVAIIAGVVSILVSVVLLFVWPLLFGALVSIGKAIVGFDVVGAGIYAFLNRLLIPTGLHHALNNVFWFDTIGLVVRLLLRMLNYLYATPVNIFCIQLEHLQIVFPLDLHSINSRPHKYLQLNGYFFGHTSCGVSWVIKHMVSSLKIKLPYAGLDYCIGS